jgi:hypothetical protein
MNGTRQKRRHPATRIMDERRGPAPQSRRPGRGGLRKLLQPKIHTGLVSLTRLATLACRWTGSRDETCSESAVSAAPRHPASKRVSQHRIFNGRNPCSMQLSRAGAGEDPLRPLEQPGAGLPILSRSRRTAHHISWRPRQQLLSTAPGRAQSQRSSRISMTPCSTLTGKTLVAS